MHDSYLVDLRCDASHQWTFELLVSVIPSIEQKTPSTRNYYYYYYTQHSCNCVTLKFFRYLPRWPFSLIKLSTVEKKTILDPEFLSVGETLRSMNLQDLKNRYTRRNTWAHQCHNSLYAHALLMLFRLCLDL